VREFALYSAGYLVSLAGIEGCTGMEELCLHNCDVSSLQPLMGLSSMKQFEVRTGIYTSLEGLNSVSLQSLILSGCTSLTELAGLQHLSALTRLRLGGCGVASLQPLSQLGMALEEMSVWGCNQVQEEVSELPHVQPTAEVDVRDSNVREVVLAGGWRMDVRPHYQSCDSPGQCQVAA
jgi:Leucine-rich repeat (LRR) protein